MDKLKEIVFFDLDNTLWYVDSYAWVIDKEKPSKPLMKIDNIELGLIKSGIYIKDNNIINYNNHTYYVSDEFVNKLKKKRKNLNLEDIGISYAEYFDEKILNNKKIDFLFHNVRHLLGENIEIGLLTARTDRKRHSFLLNKLREKLKEIGFEISKIYFVTDRIAHFGLSDNIAYAKNEILLEHLIGLEIKDGEFIPMKKDAYNKVYFYDDDIRNFLSSDDLQDYFQKLLLNSNDEVVDYIKNRIKNEILLLFNNLVTNNKVNPFNTDIIKLKDPVKYPIKTENFITNFQQFNRLR